MRPKVVSAPDLKESDVFAPIKSDSGDVPAFTKSVERLNCRPSMREDKYALFKDPESRRFVVLSQIPMVWERRTETRFDVKVIALSDDGVVVMWFYNHEQCHLL